MSGWEFDIRKTRERYRELQQLYLKRGLNADSFSCERWPECSESQKSDVVKQYSGGTAGLMPFYDVLYRGMPIRVLVIGKERSHTPQSRYGTAANFNVRSKECLATIVSQKRTFHIRGTLLTLQRIFDVESDYLYASYALSNALRCGFQQREIVQNTSSLQDTPTMWQNCVGYLAKEIEILEPTLIITQGAWAVDKQPSLVSQLSDSFGAPKCLMRNVSNGKYGLYDFISFMLITSHHPARLGLWKTRYAPDTLWPMIEYLKNNGYLPSISTEDSQIYEQLVKPAVDRWLGRDSADLPHAVS